MTATDDSILEFYLEQDEQLALPPTAVFVNLHDVYRTVEKSRDTVARRMRKLERAGLLEKVDDSRGYYSLTSKGRSYLSGELDAEDLQLEED
jgi:Mn-dependent DtxR family transcriptional regulator